jgi:DNA topoisomerase-1
MSILVIVESAGKIKKINEILGSNYIVKASFGHVQDLDKKTLSIDVENNFNPLYIISEDKLKIVNELKSLTKKCKEVIIASDGDREGEAIAYSLANVLKLHNPKRIIFHEITKSAINKAIQNPTKINMDMVYSQQARRILDRLMGYKISPILWKYLSDAKSAGRVQSVVVKIINDRENEIINSISNSYFKTVGLFNKINATLNYNFTKDTDCLNFLKSINNKTTVKIFNIENKKSIRKPSPPFVTSTLQQESSIKLRFNIKKTMDVAQKLFNSGLITYMRTDCPNISEDAIKSIEEFIINKYGEKYSSPKNYESKNANSQDAHECIRPTNILVENISANEDVNEDCIKLYNLIWKRTLASQMSNAEIDVQIIKIDLLNNSESLLIFNKEQYYFISTYENIIFPGYIIVYDNTEKDSEKESDTVNGTLILESDKLKIKKIKISEEYTKLPYGGRFTEANLVKYLEKNGIGRPSTYVSIITKIIERNYVEIKDIEGIEKKSKQFELNKFEINESIKNVIIGKENKKIVITEMGKLVNEFLIKHFESILDTNFTANLETLLDKISIGKGNWITILRNYYDIFNPIVEKLQSEKDNTKSKLLGITNDGKEIYTGTGKFGPYVKILENDNKKWKYSSTQDISDLTLEIAIELLSNKYPKLIFENISLKKLIAKIINYLIFI